LHGDNFGENMEAYLNDNNISEDIEFIIDSEYQNLQDLLHDRFQSIRNNLYLSPFSYVLLKT
jgi:hypothetical protein